MKRQGIGPGILEPAGQIHGRLWIILPAGSEFDEYRQGNLTADGGHDPDG